ncbi:uncharacterized protein LOC135689165 [Rhopilema esculentum]|uniref:uncharacterized protein LOC135689165 n=1 Tax=Rhopilema esculentum TaxID=499914 RepID=UPI0031D8420C
MAIHFELHYTKSQMVAMLCFATMFLMIGYNINDCEKADYYESRRITASIASYHLGEIKVDKPFAYYILTEKCLSPTLLDSIALGDKTRCDVYVNSYQEQCDDQNTPAHVKYIYSSKTTWTSGRNMLYEYAKATKKQYFYHIFMDDDAIPIYTEHVIEFGKRFNHREGDATLFQDYIQSEKGLKDAVDYQMDGKSAWRQFEDDLLIKSPAFAVTNLIRLPDGFESRLRMHKHWEEVCPKEKEMPPTVTTFYFDELFIAFHREAVPLLLPYTTMFDNISWHLAGVINIFRARALLYKHGMANYKISVVNHKHRFYPRGKIPRDLIKQYLRKDGKDIKGLIDSRELDYNKFSSWEQWEEVFMHTKDICTEQIKFPLWRHYRQ